MLIESKELPTKVGDTKTIYLPFVGVKEAKNHILHLNTKYKIPLMWYQADINDMSKEFVIIALGTTKKYTKKLSLNNYIGSIILKDYYGFCDELHYFLMTKSDYDLLKGIDA